MNNYDSITEKAKKNIYIYDSFRPLFKKVLESDDINKLNLIMKCFSVQTKACLSIGELCNSMLKEDTN